LPAGSRADDVTRLRRRAGSIPRRRASVRMPDVGPAPQQHKRKAFMFISPAYAQGAGGGGGDFILQLLPIVLMIVIFYFLLFRPQQQRMKAHQEMVSNIRRGDTIVTQGGLIGRVTRVKDDGVEIEVEIADNTRVRVVKSTVADVRAKGEPVKEA
jgi:preprotein translocase subunit YajC